MTFHKLLDPKLPRVRASSGIAMNLADVYAFKKVAQTLSFTRAAKQIGSSRSAISKKISRLEQDLGVVLINRTTRRVSLTEAGRTFHQQTSEIDATIERAAEFIRLAELEPCGTVAFCVPSALGEVLLPSLMSEFQARWPNLNINMHFRDGVFDLVGDGLDLAICVTRQLADSSHISRRIGETRFVLAASPGYLETHGEPKSLVDLASHQCLGIGSPAITGGSWALQEDGVPCQISVNFSMIAGCYMAVIHAAIADGGILWVPEVYIHSALEAGELQLFLESALNPQPYGIYAIFPHRNASAKVRVLVEFLIEQLQTLRDLVSEAEEASCNLATVT